MTDTKEAASSATAAPDVANAPKADRFRLRAQLLDEGSQSWTLAETGHFQMKIRCYAPKGGENAMHAHHNQDHSFVVLQGRALYHFPDGESWELGRNEGIMLPAGAYYCFENPGSEPLVVLRVMAMMPEEGDPDKRLGLAGQQIDAHTPENKRPEKKVFRDEFYE